MTRINGFDRHLKDPPEAVEGPGCNGNCCYRINLTTASYNTTYPQNPPDKQANPDGEQEDPHSKETSVTQIPSANAIRRAQGARQVDSEGHWEEHKGTAR